MIVTILDLGTNTFNILIAFIHANEYKILHNDKISVKLGEQSINEHYISQAAFSRGINAIQIYHEKALEYKSDKIIAVATSAIRSAKNGIHFIEKIYEITGISVQIISGEQEAKLIQKGVNLALPNISEKMLIMDIGGGSTEFIISEKQQILWCKSFMLGAARILEKCTISDPINLIEIHKIENCLEDHLTELFDEIKKENVNLLVGSSGSFDTFAELILHRFYTPLEIEKLKHYNFKINEFQEIYEKLIQSTHAERLNMKGLLPMRADMIVIAVIFANFILKKSGINKMKLSTYALKEGILNNLINDKPYLQ